MVAFAVVGIGGFESEQNRKGWSAGGSRSLNRIEAVIRAAQTGVFDWDIRISKRPFVDICKSFEAETGLKSRNVEKRINAVWALLIAGGSRHVKNNVNPKVDNHVGSKGKEEEEEEEEEEE
jgi:hypothetical protein